MGEIEGSSAEDPMFDANLTVLKEYVEHHVKEEEQEMFPLVKGKLDLDGIGAQITEMKARLEAKAGEPRSPRAGTKARVHLPASSSSGARSNAAPGKAKENGRGRDVGQAARPMSRNPSAH